MMAPPRKPLIHIHRIDGYGRGLSIRATPMYQLMMREKNPWFVGRTFRTHQTGAASSLYSYSYPKHTPLLDTSTDCAGRLSLSLSQAWPWVAPERTRIDAVYHAYLYHTETYNMMQDAHDAWMTTLIEKYHCYFHEK